MVGCCQFHAHAVLTPADRVLAFTDHETKWGPQPIWIWQQDKYSYLRQELSPGRKAHNHCIKSLSTNINQLQRDVINV
jgi:hypothetical protein